VLKWILLLVGVGLIYFWIKNKGRAAEVEKEKAKAQTPPPVIAESEEIRPCRHCGVHLPRSEGVIQEDRFYCSSAHRDAIDSKGWLGSAVWRVSPNFDARPNGVATDLVVLHHISLPPGQFRVQNSTQHIVDFFQNQLDPQAHPYFADITERRVSSHFLIARSGRLIQFVSTRDRAWHAGESQFEERARCNDFSIGIELEGDGDTAFEAVQYQALQTLITQLKMQNANLSFVGHSDIAPGRKTDPGTQFDWARFQKDNRLPLEKLPFGLASR
jgi:AmpD protein